MNVDSSRSGRLKSFPPSTLISITNHNGFLFRSAPRASPHFPAQVYYPNNESDVDAQTSIPRSEGGTRTRRPLSDGSLKGDVGQEPRRMEGFPPTMFRAVVIIRIPKTHNTLWPLEPNGTICDQPRHGQSTKLESLRQCTRK